MESIENEWKQMKIIGKTIEKKSLEIIENQWKTMKINAYQWKLMQINENQWTSKLKSR